MSDRDVRETEIKGENINRRQEGEEWKAREAKTRKRLYSWTHAYFKTRDHFPRRSHISGVTQSSLGFWQT